jgi:DNA-binding beta-propeller fold protein YncE
MSREAKSEDLLYVSDLGKNDVAVLAYPSGKLVGTLTGFGSVATLCADKAGDVFVVDFTAKIDVYAHGDSAPVRVLQSFGAPNGCAIDPATGNLAVTNESSYLYGTIAIYTKAKGKAKKLFDDMVDATFFCGYDDAGNLFLDGWNRAGVIIFIELPHKSNNLEVTMFSSKLKAAGGVEWDGKYIAVADTGAGQIYRVTPTARVEQTVKLAGASQIDQFWFDGTTLIGPNDESNGFVGRWKYPAGGSPAGKITGFSEPTGTALSLVKR